MTLHAITPRKRFRSKLGMIVDPARSILGLHDLILTDFEFDFHSHSRGQLAYASSGVIKVYTDSGSWIVPPSQAVWIPGGIRHSLTSSPP